MTNSNNTNTNTAGRNRRRCLYSFPMLDINIVAWTPEKFVEKLRIHNNQLSAQPTSNSKDFMYQYADRCFHYQHAILRFGNEKDFIEDLQKIGMLVVKELEEEEENNVINLFDCRKR